MPTKNVIDFWTHGESGFWHSSQSCSQRHPTDSCTRHGGSHLCQEVKFTRLANNNDIIIFATVSIFVHEIRLSSPEFVLWDPEKVSPRWFKLLSTMASTFIWFPRPVDINLQCCTDLNPECKKRKTVNFPRVMLKSSCRFANMTRFGRGKSEAAKAISVTFYFIQFNLSIRFASMFRVFSRLIHLKIAQIVIF